MKKILVIVFIVAVGYGLFQLLSQKPKNINVADNEAELIIFWGIGCPHCENVKKYITDNQLDSKVKISLKEVYYNKDNQALLENTVKKCPEIDTSKGIGVPLSYDTTNGKCLLGDQPTIDWLKAKVLQ